jgi:ABC-type enterobactin transport system permease subunit
LGIASVAIDPKTFIDLNGPQIAERIRQLRISAVKQLVASD